MVLAQVRSLTLKKVSNGEVIKWWRQVVEVSGEGKWKIEVSLRAKTRVTEAE